MDLLRFGVFVHTLPLQTARAGTLASTTAFDGWLPQGAGDDVVELGEKAGGKGINFNLLLAPGSREPRRELTVSTTIQDDDVAHLSLSLPFTLSGNLCEAKDFEPR